LRAMTAGYLSATAAWMESVGFPLGSGTQGCGATVRAT
jgi:hypothetical protein